MNRWVALLRGVNVGGHRVKMDELRGHFSDMGFEEVATHIASGNVIFSATEADAAALEPRIEEALEAALGWAAPTFIRTFEELQAAVDHDPEGATDEDTVYVGFMKSPADQELRRALRELETEEDRFDFRGREFYWLRHGKISDSPLFKGSALDRALKDTPHTSRKVDSVRKLLAKHAD